MMKSLLLTGAMLALLAPMALAGGVNINWGSGCWSDGTRLEDLAFACNTNSGYASMTCSFMTSYAQPDFVGLEIDLEGMSATCTIPSWWQMGSGECRRSAISASADSLTGPQIGCVDMWQNQAIGGLAYYYDGANTNPWELPARRARMVAVFAVPAESPIPLEPDVEYYAASIRITYAKTVGEGSCSGCQYPFLWGLYSIKVAELTQYEMLTEVLPDGNQCLRWQHAAASCYYGFSSDCIVPTRNPTWGQIKTLYR